MVRKSIPLARQVVQEILSGIESGKLARANGALPSEAELSARFQVSRATLREALTELEHRNLVVRKHGVGTEANRDTGSHRQCAFQHGSLPPPVASACKPKSHDDAACRDRFVKEFGRRAFRRPLSGAVGWTGRTAGFCAPITGAGIAAVATGPDSRCA